jgi:hypothetical protein
MEEALRARLLATAALSALVGDRINWGLRTQGAPLPSVDLHMITDVAQTNLAGPSGWSAARVQVDCWGRTYKAARDVSDTIGPAAGADGLHCLRATLSGIRFRIFVIDRVSDTDTDSAGVIHRTRLDLNVWWNPTQGD